MNGNSEVYFREISRDCEFYRDFLVDFQAGVSEIDRKLGYSRPGDIEIVEVYVIKKKKPEVSHIGFIGSDYGSGGGSFGGDCVSYMMCGSWNQGGGGGYHTDPQEPEPDPCENNQNIAENYVVRAKNNILKTKTADTKEHGYTFDRASNGNLHARDNTSVTSDRMSVTIRSNTVGYNHTHIEKDGVVNMFSPSDIRTFVEIVRNARDNNIPYQELFATMVFKQDDRYYVYQLTYTGDGNDIPAAFIDRQLDNFGYLYRKEVEKYIEDNDGQMTIEQGYELFFNTLKNMGLKNVELSDVSNPSKPVRIENNNGSPNKVECS